MSSSSTPAGTNNNPSPLVTSPPSVEGSMNRRKVVLGVVEKGIWAAVAALIVIFVATGAVGIGIYSRFLNLSVLNNAVARQIGAYVMAGGLGALGITVVVAIASCVAQCIIQKKKSHQHEGPAITKLSSSTPDPTAAQDNVIEEDIEEDIKGPASLKSKKLSTCLSKGAWATVAVLIVALLGTGVIGLGIYTNFATVSVLGHTIMRDIGAYMMVGGFGVFIVSTVVAGVCLLLGCKKKSQEIILPDNKKINSVKRESTILETVSSSPQSNKMDDPNHRPPLTDSQKGKEKEEEDESSSEST